VYSSALGGDSRCNVKGLEPDRLSNPPDDAVLVPTEGRRWTGWSFSGKAGGKLSSGGGGSPLARFTEDLFRPRMWFFTVTEGDLGNPNPGCGGCLAPGDLVSFLTGKVCDLVSNLKASIFGIDGVTSDFIARWVYGDAGSNGDSSPFLFANLWEGEGT